MLTAESPNVLLSSSLSSTQGEFVSSASPAGNGTGSGDDGAIDGHAVRFAVHEMLECIHGARVRADAKRMDRRELRSGEQGEACPRASDIGQEAVGHRTSRAASARITSAYQRAEAFGIRRCVA